MPKIQLTDRFIAFYSSMPSHIRKKVDRQVKQLAEDPRHPSLQTKPIQGTNGIYEARIDLVYRLIYELCPNDILLLRVFAKHDEALKKPK